MPCQAGVGFDPGRNSGYFLVFPQEKKGEKKEKKKRKEGKKKEKNKRKGEKREEKEKKRKEKNGEKLDKGF